MYVIKVSNKIVVIIAFIGVVIKFAGEYYQLNLKLKKIYLNKHNLDRAINPELQKIVNPKARVVMYPTQLLYHFSGAFVLFFRKKPLLVVDPKINSMFEKDPDATKAIIYHENFHIDQNHAQINLILNFIGSLLKDILLLSVIYYYFEKNNLIFATIFFIMAILNETVKHKIKYIFLVPFILNTIFLQSYKILLLIFIQVIISSQNQQKNEIDADTYALQQIQNKQAMLEAFSRKKVKSNFINIIFATHPTTKRRRANILKQTQ